MRGKKNLPAQEWRWTVPRGSGRHHRITLPPPQGRPRISWHWRTAVAVDTPSVGGTRAREHCSRHNRTPEVHLLPRRHGALRIPPRRRPPHSGRPASKNTSSISKHPRRNMVFQPNSPSSLQLGQQVTGTRNHSKLLATKATTPRFPKRR